MDEMAAGLYQALQATMDLKSRLGRYEYSKNFTWKKTALGIMDAFTGRTADLRKAKNDDEPLTVISDEKKTDSDFIDVRKRMREWSVEDLCETAEAFFARINNWDYLHAKPYAAVSETSELLINFAH